MRHLENILLTLCILVLILSCDLGTPPMQERNNPWYPGNTYDLELTAQISAGGIALSWNILDMPGVAGYNLYRAVNDSVFALKYSSPTRYDSTFLDTLIQNGYCYTYRVNIHNTEGDTAVSNTVGVVINSLPVVSIDAGDFTPARQIQLTLLAYGAAKMQVGTPDLTDVLWEDYATSKSLTLKTGSGMKVVQARFIFSYGDTSAVVGDSTQPLEMSPDIVINRDSLYTATRQVWLYPSAQGANLQIKVSEDSTFEGVQWSDIQDSLQFQLSTGEGVKTVYCKVKNDFEVESGLVYDNISPLPMNASFNIANNAQYTPARQVWLFPSANGANLKCKFSENNQFTGANWVDYADSISFTLSTGAGNKTVYCKVKNDFEIESGVVYDNISPLPMNASSNIANNAQYTMTRLVTLFMSAQGENLKYMASSDSAFPGLNFQDLTATTSFTLPTGEGIKTVYVKFMNDFEIDTLTSDQIEPNPMNITFNINPNSVNCISRTISIGLK